MSENTASSSGCYAPLAVLLTVAFVVLKLCKVIDWSWWWVLSPVWITLILTVLVIAIFIPIFIWTFKD